MTQTKVFENGGSLAVRLPKQYALPLGDVMIDQRDGMIVLMPIDDKGWPDDLETRFLGMAGIEAPERDKESRLVKLY